MNSSALKVGVFPLKQSLYHCAAGQTLIQNCW